MIHKETIIEQLINVFKSHHDVIALLEGGSVATNHSDQYSDLDIQIICNDGSVETLIKTFDTHIKNHYKIITRYRVIEPTWHGFSQVFYELDDLEPCVYLDVVFIEEHIKDKFKDEKRHGVAKIHFMKRPIKSIDTYEGEKLEVAIKESYQEAVETAFIRFKETKKNILRKRYSEAYLMYIGLLNKNLAPLLNIVNRKHKFDFGLRYAYRDYQTEDFALVEEALQVYDLKSLEKSFYKVQARFETLKKALDKVYGKHENR